MHVCLWISSEGSLLHSYVTHFGWMALVSAGVEQDFLLFLYIEYLLYRHVKLVWFTYSNIYKYLNLQTSETFVFL